MNSRRTSTASAKSRRNTSVKPPLSPTSEKIESEENVSKILINIVERYKNCDEKGYPALLNEIQTMIEALKHQGLTDEINNMVAQTSPRMTGKNISNRTHMTTIGCAVKNNAYYLTKALLACGVKKDGIHCVIVNNKNQKEELTLEQLANNNGKMLGLLNIPSMQPIQALPLPRRLSSSHTGINPSSLSSKNKNSTNLSISTTLTVNTSSEDSSASTLAKRKFSVSSAPPNQNIAPAMTAKTETLQSNLIPAPIPNESEAPKTIHETIGLAAINLFKKDLNEYQQARQQQPNEYDFTIKFTLFGKEFKFERGTYSRTQKLAAVSAAMDFIEGKIPKGDLINHIGALEQGNLGKILEKHSMLWQTLINEAPKQTTTQGLSL